MRRPDPRDVDDLAGNWRAAGACARPDVPADVMTNPAHTRRAKALCAICPVWRPCLDEGLEEPEGIWAGLGPADRDRLRRLRARLRSGSPDPHATFRDARRLLMVGMSPERLAVATGLDPATINRAATSRRISS